MTDATWDAVREAVYARWPALRNPRDDDEAWSVTIRRDFAAAVKRLDINPQQADAALGALAMRCRSKRPYAREIVSALQAAQGPGGSLSGTPAAMTPAAETWRRWLDDRANQAAYQGLAREWLASHRPRAAHLAGLTGALLMPRDPLYGPMSREFLSWVATRAQSNGVAIGPDGQIVRASEGAA